MKEKMLLCCPIFMEVKLGTFVGTIHPSRQRQFDCRTCCFQLKGSQYPKPQGQRLHEAAVVPESMHCTIQALPNKLLMEVLLFGLLHAGSGKCEKSYPIRLDSGPYLTAKPGLSLF